MPELLLMRHGKAAQGERVADRERPLTPRGRRDCDRIGRMLAVNFRPDRILCSTAVRARQTLAALLAGMGDVSDVVLLDELYDPPGDYTDVIARHGAGASRLLLIGHNPAIQETALVLIGAGDGHERTGIHEKFPTSAVAVIALEGQWRKIEPLSGRLTAFLTP